MKTRLLSLSRWLAVGMVCFGSLLHVAVAEVSPGYLELNGVDRYMSIAQSDAFSFNASKPITMTFRVKATTWTSTSPRLVSDRTYSGTNNNYASGFDWFMGPSSTQSFGNNVNVNTNGASWANLGNPYLQGYTLNTWCHLAWTYDGTTSKVYINGSLGNSVTNNKGYVNVDCLGDILVGAGYAMSGISTAGQFLFTGQIDELRFYSEVLSDAEIATDVTSDTPLAGKTLIAAYDFTDIVGTTVPDISGNGHNGTLIGTWPDYGPAAESYVVNITSNLGGRVVVTNAQGNVISNGTNVATGSVITITATPDNNYTLKSIAVNGNALTVNNNVATHTVNGVSNIVVTFAYTDDVLTKVPVFTMGENGSQYYRIPAIAKAKDGSLIAVADQRGSSLGDLPNTISVVAKRSTDNGETWSDMVTLAQGNSATGKTYGDPAIVCDRNNGRLIVVYSGDQGFWTSNKTNRAGFYVSISDDNGLTWTGPTSITDQVYLNTWYGAFCASGSMCQLKSGRICFVANAHMSATSGQDVNEYMVYSDDSGITWHTSTSNGSVGYKGNESKIVELADGTLLMSIRNYEGGQHRFCKSTDGGMTWGTPYEHPDILEPSCNGDIIRYPSQDGRNRLLLSIPNSNIRENVSVFVSYDEAETWPVKKTVVAGYSAYSSLEVLDDGTICCLVEEGKWDSNLAGTDGFNISLVKFPLEWLTDGMDHFDPLAEASNDAPIFITIGQSNADGSAFFDATLDQQMSEWYTSAANTGRMKIWYRSTQIQNQSANALGEAARWVIDGTTTDVAPGWLDLWYRNENTSGRTAMNMIHNYGTYSTGTGTDCAQGRRGMEGQFGKTWATEYPDKDLYIIKLGASGSFISSWANPLDNTNWDYFYEKMFKPAVEDLLAQGKRPRLAGIWWMQGCADSNKDQAYYQEWLEKLVDKCHTELGFENGTFYIGHVVKPGENPAYSTASVSFGQGVRDAQDAVAAAYDNVEIVDTKNVAFQYEANLGGYLHYSHAGVNTIGEMLAQKAIAAGPSNWDLYSTPGTWQENGASVVFVPSIGNPDITYYTEGSTITATLTYPGWSEVKTYDFNSCKITIVAPKKGSVTVSLADGTEIASGDYVGIGTELNVVPVPAQYYFTASVNVNGEPLDENEGVYSFTVTEASEITVTFERDPDAPVEYCTPEGNLTHGSRYTTTLTVTDGTNTVAVTPCQANATSSVYVDKTDVIFVTEPSNEVTIRITAGQGEWMHHYVFVDYNQDGEFIAELANNIPTENSELVSFDRYSPSNNGVFYDSKGTVYSTGSQPGNPNPGGAAGITASNAVTLPTFTVPADLTPGDYRIRFMREWNSIDPCGRTTENGYDSNLITANGGAVIDFTLRIEGELGAGLVNVVDADAPVEFYTLQGLKVRGDNLKPGLYIRRQGSTASIVLVTK